MNRKVIAFAGVVVLVILCAYLFFAGRKTEAQPAPVVKARPISDVDCGQTYQFDQIKRFRVNGNVVVNFHFGGQDRHRQPQYIVDRNVIGQSTEVREARRVDRSLAYSEVTVLCLSDQPLEGHKASNVEVMRYRLTLRRPLVSQTMIPEGGKPRQ